MMIALVKDLGYPYALTHYHVNTPHYISCMLNGIINKVIK